MAKKVTCLNIDPALGDHGGAVVTRLPPPPPPHLGGLQFKPWAICGKIGSFLQMVSSLQ